MEKIAIEFGGKKIEFELQRKHIKNINLLVKPDMKIIVSANESVPLEFIFDFIKGKAPWILRNVGYFKDTKLEHQVKREYVSGETHKYLGKQYRLVVNEVLPEGVKYFQGFIQLNVRDKANFVRKERLLYEWFRTKAEKIFQESFDRIYP